MTDLRIRYGIPDTLPPRGLNDLRGYLWFGGTGFLLCLTGLCAHLPVGRWIVLALVVGWVILPVRELLKRREHQAMDAQYRNCVIVVLVFCLGFTLWARYLDLSWVVVL